MILKRINKLKNVGIFQDFEWPNPNAFPDFKKYNIIYGWNGSGKSTLTELLQLFESEIELPQRFKNSEFEIFFSDNDGNEFVINQNNIDSAPLIRVFNKEFIKKHIKWEKIQAESIAYLGKEDADRKKEVDRLKEKQNELIDELSAKQSDKDNVVKDIKQWKKDNAKIIKEALTTEGRSDEYANYDTSNIKSQLNSTFSDRNKGYTHLIESEEELSKIKKAIHQTPKAALPNIEVRVTGLSSLFESLKELLKETVVSKAIKKLQEKPEIEKWVRNGFYIHKEKSLKVCQFCDQIIPDDRITKLEGHFSDTYDDFLEKIESLKLKIKQANVDLENPHVLEFDSSLQPDFKKKLNEFGELEDKYERICKNLLEEIQKKENSLHKPIETAIKLDQELEFDIQNIVEQLNIIVNKHNQIFENFEEEALRKKKIWEKSHIASNLDELIKLEKIAKEYEDDLKKLIDQIKKLKKRIDQLQDELSGDRQAAMILNDYLTQYLGRDEIQVVFDEETKGFYFKRGDDEATNLSEGEKTGIALIYFLTKLGERDFNINDCIVVIDDPVSSLDTNSLFYAFSFIKEHCKKSKQLILLTHNFELLRQLNKWLKYENNKESRFMIKIYQNNKGRYSIIEKLDPLLTNYESEYHYLFKLLHDKRESEDDSFESAFHFPNIARRYLEMFFSFRTPGNNTMHKKIEKAVKDEAITQEEGTSLRHFLNTYSHGDNEETFTRFDVTHLEKSREVIDSVLNLVENYDTDHYNDMIELVTQ